MADVVEGGCQCGRVRYRVLLDDDDAYLCHCRMCQRATGGVSIALKTVRKDAVTWAGEPDWYGSSAIARRPFCSACGTPLGFAYVDSPTMDFTVGSFDAPERFRPVAHFGAESLHSAWIDTRDQPRQRADTYAPLVERWTNATDNG